MPGSQVATTRQSNFLAWQGAAYLPSPVYAVKPASLYEQYRWSSDGSRLAYVSPTTSDSPARISQKIAAGENPEGATRVGVWSRDTGRSRDLFVAGPKDGVGDFTFLARDLVFTTSGETSEGTVQRLWIARDGGPPTALPFPGLGGAPKLLASRRRDAIVVVGSKQAWLMTTTQTLEVRAPGQSAVIGHGVSADDRAILMVIDAAGAPKRYLVDFVTSTPQPVPESVDPGSGRAPRPFILDAYQLAKGSKGSLVEDDRDAERVDGKPAMISDEDGGYRLDLVERGVTNPRRVPFLHETSRIVKISDNGLAYAFVSNRTLMVRWMIKADRKTSDRLLGSGG